MKKIIVENNDSNTIRLSDVDKSDPIFAKQGGVLKGMVVHEPTNGWILRTGGRFGATGHHPTLEDCVKSCLEHEYEFFT